MICIGSFREPIVGMTSVPSFSNKGAHLLPFFLTSSESCFFWGSPCDFNAADRQSHEHQRKG